MSTFLPTSECVRVVTLGKPRAPVGKKVGRMIVTRLETVKRR
jgi:hypothetical protein